MEYSTQAIEKAEQHIEFTRKLSMHAYTNIILQELLDIIEAQGDKMHRIKTWIDAYPLKIFPEPDFKEVHRILQEHGISLDSISASNMRHVLKGIQKIIGEDYD